jgi:transposase InsO family protein
MHGSPVAALQGGRDPHLGRERVAHCLPGVVDALGLEMDITYIAMARGFVYLAAVIDWATRRVLSWRLSISMEVDFCLEAVEEALAK